MDSARGRAVILGAGPAGLAAAFELARSAWPVDIIERASVVGGLARTVQRDGFRFDIGGHRWFTKNDELNQLFMWLLAGEFVYVDRISRIYYDGRYVDYPLQVGNALRSIGPVMSMRAIMDYLWAQLRPPTCIGERSMQDAYIAQFGRTLYRRFFSDYSEKVWGAACNQLSGDWVVQRSKGMSLLTTVKDALWQAKKDSAVESLIERFMYPRFGYGRLSERLAEECVTRGARLQLNTEIAAIHHRNGRITAVDVDHRDGRRERFESDYFVSSIPMPGLMRLLRPAPPAPVLAAAKSLTFRDLITVNLMLRRRRVTEDTWIYIHDPAIPFGRIHEPKNWSAAMVPNDECTSLVVEFFCRIGDEIWSHSDEALCEMAVEHLSRTLGLIEPNEVMGAFAIRSPNAYPTYHLGYKAPLESLKAYAATFSNLQLIGRAGAFHYDNADHAIEHGLLAARNLLGGNYDLAGVNAAQEYLEVRRGGPRSGDNEPAEPPPLDWSAAASTGS
jgi:protoporphyrinogen oxidase